MRIKVIEVITDGAIDAWDLNVSDVEVRHP